jgi:hypothetical protein
MDSWLRQQHVLAAIWVALNELLPFFLHWVLNYDGLFLNLRPHRVHPSAVFQSYFSLNRIEAEWIDLCDDRPLLNVYHVDVHILPRFYCQLWLLIILLRN